MTRESDRALIKAIERNRMLDDWRWRQDKLSLADWDQAVPPAQEDAVYLKEVISALVKHCSRHGHCASDAAERFLMHCDNSSANRTDADPHRERANVMRQRKWLREWVQAKDV